MNTSVYDHYRNEDEGIYRVVGVTDEKVTLLRVADPDGRRTHTGEVVTVTRDELDTFEGAPNPDAKLSPVDTIASLPETAYWSVRVFTEELTEHPVPSLAALVLVVVGFLGKRSVPLPDPVFGAMIFFGSIGLAYLGSGSLSR
jgi:hypothetical protein